MVCPEKILQIFVLASRRKHSFSLRQIIVENNSVIRSKYIDWSLGCFQILQFN